MKWQITWFDDDDIMISIVSTHEMIMLWLAQKFFHTFPYLKIQLCARYI